VVNFVCLVRKGGCAEALPFLTRVIRCFGGFGSVVCLVCGLFLGILRVLGPLLP